MTDVQPGSGAPPIRASDAERDQVAEILRAGYAEDRLTRAEFDERIAAAYAAKTIADLRDLTGVLPPATSRVMTGGRLPAVEPSPDQDRCFLLCLLVAFPPAGIIHWILTRRRRLPAGAA
jgi:hypothetical protein